MNAGFLVIRPDAVVFQALHEMYLDTVDKHSRITEQTMIRKLFYDIGTMKEHDQKRLDSQSGVVGRIGGFLGMGHQLSKSEAPSDPYYYRFPYEYNSPRWHSNRERPGGWRGMKNIHNKGIWISGDEGFQREWLKTWNVIWALLRENGMADTILDLDKCKKSKWSKKHNSRVCTKDILR